MNELQILGMLFIGMAIGSVNPLGVYGLVSFLVIATIFYIIGLYFEIKEEK